MSETKEPIERSLSPGPKKHIMMVRWAYGSLVAFGGFLAALVYAGHFLTCVPISAVFSGIVVVLWFAGGRLLRRHPLEWQYAGRHHRITNLGPELIATLVGIVALPWISLAIQGLSRDSAQRPLRIVDFALSDSAGVPTLEMGLRNVAPEVQYIK